MMKTLLLSVLCIPALYTPVATQSNKTGLQRETLQQLTAQPEPTSRMSAIVFKSQDYCRAEMEDFEFDAPFSIVSATVYFTGANFKGVEKGNITSSSLKPISGLKSRCIPGSIVLFDDIKVKGPDNQVRTIASVSYKLY